jgi:hypothetical protein
MNRQFIHFTADGANTIILKLLVPYLQITEIKLTAECRTHVKQQTEQLNAPCNIYAEPH